MPEISQRAQDFLNAVFEGARLDLRARATGQEGARVLDLDGNDSSLLRSEGGELLDALEHLVNQAFMRELPHGERIVCDVHNTRALREAELRAMAGLAADRVRSSGVKFTFNPMSSNERRIIHLALANEEDLHTESVGEGNMRRLVVSLKVTSVPAAPPE